MGTDEMAQEKPTNYGLDMCNDCTYGIIQLHIMVDNQANVSTGSSPDWNLKKPTGTHLWNLQTPSVYFYDEALKQLIHIRKSLA